MQGQGKKFKKQEKLPPIKNVRDPFPKKKKKKKKKKQKSWQRKIPEDR